MNNNSFVHDAFEALYPLANEDFLKSWMGIEKYGDLKRSLPHRRPPTKEELLMTVLVSEGTNLIAAKEREIDGALTSFRKIFLSALDDKTLLNLMTCLDKDS